MKKLKVFISGVQNELTKVWEELADNLRHEPLLGTSYELFLFEETPANTIHDNIHDVPSIPNNAK